MAARQSNIITNIHPVTDNYRGENYWFNGCAAYVMEALAPKEKGESVWQTDYDYSLFAGVTGDNFTQIWPLDGKFRGDCASDFISSAEYVVGVFDKIGYAAEYITDKMQFAQKVVDSIDKNVPVICYGKTGNYSEGWTVIGGYEDGGGTFIHMATANYGKEKSSISDAIAMIFVGEKVRDVPLAQIYREAFVRLPKMLTTKTNDYVFGAQAFREWANFIERGGYDGIELANNWEAYTNYVCVLATNGSCCYSFLEKAMELNPDLAFLSEISALYRKLGSAWGGENNPDEDSLEALGGGFNITSETMNAPDKRLRIINKLRYCADISDEIVRLITENMASEIALRESFEYIKLNKVRFIGIDARQVREGSALEENWERLWERSGEYMPALNELATEYGTDITAPCSMMHHNGNDVDSENHYLAGRFFKADTPVPEGYDYYDVPTENAAYAVYTTNHYDGSLGAAYFATRDKVLADGVGIPYPHAYWHAEVYIDGRPHDGHYRFAYLFSADGKAEGKIV